MTTGRINQVTVLSPGPAPATTGRPLARDGSVGRVARAGETPEGARVVDVEGDLPLGGSRDAAALPGAAHSGTRPQVPSGFPI